MGVQVISFNCVLKNRTGQVISSTYNHDVLATEPPEGSLLKGLSHELQNLTIGEKRKISLNAEQAYGFYDPQKVILFPRNKLPRTIKVGQAIQIAGKSGQIRSYKVLHFHENMVSLDGNHPLAGQDLVFEIEILNAREASLAEISEANNVITEQLLN